MKTTLGAIAVTLALIAGIGGASAMPHSDAGDFDYETVFVPKD